MTRLYTQLKSKFSLKYLLLTVIFLPFAVNAQDRLTILTGTVTGSDQNPIPYASVYVKNTTRGAVCDENGKYYFRIPHGTHVLVAEALGYDTSEIEIEFGRSDRREVNFVLKTNAVEIEKAVVNGKSIVKQVNESAYNVIALDATLLHNTTMDIGSVLDRVSGIKIRETGGMGSDSRINLNGFSGKHVKIFMDGMPMEGSGSSMRIGNIPVNLAERIEIYKGVVPVELGGDALGGAINIVTKKTQSTYLDVSYSYGSFNTHKSNISFGHTTKDGFTFSLNAYQNYSDNSYKVKTKLLDLESGIYSTEDHWFRRFHDNYHNEAVGAKIGVVNKSWADRLLFGFTYGKEKADIQNANVMQIVYGGKFKRAESLIPSLNYEKRNLFTENLNFSLTGNYNSVKNNVFDTISRRYNWSGEYINTTSMGEGTYTKSDTKNNSLYVTANLNYNIGIKHYFSLNHIFNNFERKNNDSAAATDDVTDGTFMKRKNNKNITGLSYRFAPVDKWSALAFVKYYDIRITGPVEVSSSGNRSTYEEQEKHYSITGYGAATTYMFNRDFQIKVSYEKTYRLPTETELFGDEVSESGDASLKPEHSNNINLNLSYDKAIGNSHTVFLNAGLIYRDTRDYIRRQVEQRYGGAYNTNHGKVRTLGVDFEARYFYKNNFNIGGNITYQDIRNMEKYSITGLELLYYKDRMPNVPYLFSNVDAGYSFFDVLGKGNLLTIGYNMQYVHKFYRSWQSEGSTLYIPGQLSHDISVTYSLKDGRYNIGFEARNLTNHLLYDNYSLQKPGRSFSVKFRYYLLKMK